MWIATEMLIFYHDKYDSPFVQMKIAPGTCIVQNVDHMSAACITYRL